MNSKYTVRCASEEIVGMFYRSPKLGEDDVVIQGSVDVGGPLSFEDAGLDTLGSFTGGEVQRIEMANPSKFRLRLKGVSLEEYIKGLKDLRQRGFSLEKVTGFRRLMG